MFAAIEQWPLAAELRGSVWLYPLVNAVHIVGIALLFGAIVPLDLRLAGLWARLPMAPLQTILTPVAAGGLVLAVGAGALLFIAKAQAYASSGLFQVKMGLVLLAILNAVGLRAGMRRGLSRHWQRLAALASIALWLAAILAGRLLGYFRDYF